MLSLPRCMIFADGENLVFRYQDMLGQGKKPWQEHAGDVIHDKDEFLWNAKIASLTGAVILRASYYTTKVGGLDELGRLSNRIANVHYRYEGGDGFLNPHVFKKASQSQKTKSVDINIVTDMLRHTFNDSTDEVLLLAGDGDYLPAVEEVMRQGTRVYLGAFSSGLNEQLRLTVDEFFDLDRLFFRKDDPAD